MGKKSKKKSEIIPKPVIYPATDSNIANDLLETVSTAEADYAMAYTDVPGGRIMAESKRYPGGTREAGMTAVPKTRLLKDHKADIKAMKAGGEKMETIAKKMGMSISYAYKLYREKD